MIDFHLVRMWGHRRNIERYCRLLATELTDLERQYLHRWIAEEYAQFAFAASAFKEFAHLLLRHTRSPGAPGRLWCAPLSPFFAPLLSRPPLPTPLLLLLRSPGIT